jgi:hypothetical protein
VAHGAVVVDDPVRAEHVTRLARDLKREVDVVHLGHRHHDRGQLPLVLEPPEPERQELGLRDLGRHPRELLLRDLERRERLVEHDPFLRVAERLVEAGHGGADRPPRDAVPRLRQTGEGRTESLRLGEPVLLGDGHVLQIELARDGGPERELPLHVGRLKALRPLLDEEAADTVLGTSPDDCDVGERSVRDPTLGPVEDPAIAIAIRLRQHPRWVRAEVGLRQPEAADRLALGHPRKPPLLLLVGAVTVDRVHAQRALNGREAPEPRVAALELLHHEPVRDVVHPRAAVAREVGSEEPELGHLGNELDGEGPVLPHVLDDARQELTVHELAHRVARKPLLRREFVFYPVEIQRFERHEAELYAWMPSLASSFRRRFS